MACPGNKEWLLTFAKLHMVLSSLGNTICHHDCAAVAPVRFSERQGCLKVASVHSGRKQHEGDGSE